MAVCGIAVTREGRPVDTAELEAMTSALAVRAGSACQRDSDPEIGLGITSPTATIDLWKSAKVAVACDADISNQRAIRARVKSLPSDASLANVFAELFLLDGPDFLKQLRGVFAIAIWDYQSQTLLLATDRFGVKPLCYSSSSDTIVFASHARGILASGRVEKVLNPTALVNYLNFTVVPAPLSAFKSISKLSPGSYLIWKKGTAHTRQYWEMTYPEDARGTTKGLATQLLERMTEAVNCSSSDVGVSGLGCFLSGGTDSSSVVGLLTRLKNNPVTSLSIGFNEERFNELQYASLAAKHFGSRHIVGRLGPDDAFNILPMIVDLYDEPFANSSVIPTYYCLRMAREHGIEVMLAGDGGDELFGGNERYRTQQVYELYKKIPAILRNHWINPVISRISDEAPGIAGKFRRYIDTSNTPNPDRYLRWATLQFFSPEQILGPTMPFRNGHGDLLAIARAHYHAAPATDEMNRLLYIDVKMTLGDNDLPKVTRAADLAGVNVRFPFLDYPLAEFSGSIPSRLKVKGLEKRYLFKQATSNLLPKSILEKRKHGFGLPIGMWLKTDPKMRQMTEQVLRDPLTYQRGYFQLSFIEKIFSAMDQDNTPFYGEILWLFLMLELWHRRHMEKSA